MKLDLRNIILTADERAVADYMYSKYWVCCGEEVKVLVVFNIYIYIYSIKDTYIAALLYFPFFPTYIPCSNTDTLWPKELESDFEV